MMDNDLTVISHHRLGNCFRLFCYRSNKVFNRLHHLWMSDDKMDDRCPGFGYPHECSLYDVDLDVTEGLLGRGMELVAGMRHGVILRQPDMSQIFLISIGDICFIKGILEG